jgi:hypothetical protein
MLVRDAQTKDIEIDTENCIYCKGNSAVVKSYDLDTKVITYKTSKELCEEVQTCTATIDWDKVYGRE